MRGSGSIGGAGRGAAPRGRSPAALALWLGLGLLGAPLGGCGEADTTLSGSIGRTHGLAFESVELRRLDTSYVVAYLRGAETVARLSFTPAAAVPVGTAVPLDFGARGNAGLSRATSDALAFPAPRDGTITFFGDVGAATAGAEVRGRFGVQFTSGDTLSGAFLAPLQIAAR